MSKPNPTDRYYSRDHEWVIYYSDGTAMIGITDYAQEMLTDIVFVDLPEIGRKVVQHATVAVVESVKSVSDVFSPVSGEVIDVNGKLEETPELINQDAFGEGWIVKMRLSDADELKMLLNATDYEEMLKEEKKLKMDYCPHTSEDIKQMQAAIGIASIDELFADIPQKFRLKQLPDIPTALSELEATSVMSELAGKNKLPRFTLTGAGAYHHFIPAVVGHIIGRAEFYTAYTPYQAEISQGILQAIYEYQTMIAHLTGTEIANASMYDGASAMAEAAVLCAKMSGRNKIIVARSVHPEYRQVLRTYSWANGYTVVELPYAPSGQIDLNALQGELDDQVAAVLVQSPNFFGVIEEIAPIADAAHKKGALLVAGFTDGTSLGILKPAGAAGADFVAGEGQSFGNPLNYGGPYLGVFAAREKFMRRIPGRLVGATVDKNGQRGFVLTLQTREQHIRREKATSNICSNEAFCALAAGVYLAALGKNLKKLAELNINKTQYLKNKLLGLTGWKEVFSSPVYNEFVLRCPDSKQVNERLKNEGIIGGYELQKDYPELENALLFCATEMIPKEDIDKIAAILK